MLLDLGTNVLLYAILGGPTASFFLLTGAMLFGHSSERTVAGLVRLPLFVAFVAATLLALRVFPSGQAELVTLRLGGLLGHGHGLELFVDRLAVSMVVLTTLALVLVGHFSFTYLHRDRGHARFFALLSLFGMGMTLIVLSATLDVLLIGWELVGLTSALLIGFFRERDAPARNGLYAFVVYRICDAGLLLAWIVWHGTGRAQFVGGESASTLSPALATLLASLLLVAAMGKSAQLPFGTWLPRAMEGPTPSSAIFYGALSVHAGVYLLLRSSPLLEAASGVRIVVIAVGVATAIYGTLLGRIQSDIKNALAYATMTQTGLLFVEIGLGLTTLAFVHLVGHASLRMFQFLRVPSVLQDHAAAIDGLGERPRAPGRHLEWLFPPRLRDRLYALAMTRFFFDDVVEYGLKRPLRALVALADALESRWVALLTASPERRRATLPTTLPRPSEAPRHD